MFWGVGKGEDAGLGEVRASGSRTSVLCAVEYAASALRPGYDGNIGIVLSIAVREAHGRVCAYGAYDPAKTESASTVDGRGSLVKHSRDNPDAKQGS